MPPPTLEDFRAFFKVRKQTQACFWSGIRAEEAAEFARAHGRHTLEMLVGNHWLEYRLFQPFGYWLNWPEAVEKFWRIAAQAFAEVAFEEVFVYMSTQTAAYQRQPESDTCWYQIEKPELLRSKNGNNEIRVRSVHLYMHPYMQENHRHQIQDQDD
ncbi:hypothetical protein FQN57_002786 [Myotisia sp. PD_48]|nr:hypothetical protein FQN57_002786 [Myotisia sp. PD_48]